MSFLPRSLNRVLTVDIEMPRMDGLTFLKQLMQTQPLPVILISSLAQSSCEIALTGLRLGAVDVLAKPSGPYSVGDLRPSLAGRVRAAALRETPANTAGGRFRGYCRLFHWSGVFAWSLCGRSLCGWSLCIAQRRRESWITWLRSARRRAAWKRLRPC